MRDEGGPTIRAPGVGRPIPIVMMRTPNAASAIQVGSLCFFIAVLVTGGFLASSSSHSLGVDGL